MGIRELITAPRLPRQNACVELVIGFDQLRVSGSHRDLQRAPSAPRPLSSHVDYYRYNRTHLSLHKDRPNASNSGAQNRKIVALPQVGGLRHSYEERLAA